MILNLLEKGWFNDPKTTPIESALDADFHQAVTLISIENAAL